MTSRQEREKATTNEIKRGQYLAEDSANIGRGILSTLATQQGMTHFCKIYMGGVNNFYRDSDSKCR